MSRFFSGRYSALEPYVPGEQPRERKYVKLNTNESPYPPSTLLAERVQEQCPLLNLYSDPECTVLRGKLAAHLGVRAENVLPTNGSDEALNFAFMAFGDGAHPFAFADITYGFYPVFCTINGVSYEEIPLREDFSIGLADYAGIGKNIVIANPNAPTGIALPRAELERVVASNPDSVVVIDEAYVDFGAESCVSLIDRYDNLLVTQTFSKSRSLAGARLGFAVGCAELIADLNTVKYSTNPYNVNRMTMTAGAAALDDDGYYMANCREIAATRDYVSRELRKLGFELTDSRTNFVFCRAPGVSGAEMYAELRARGVLVRHFDKPRITDYNRVSIGTREQMDLFLDAVRDILNQRGGTTV